MDQITSLAAIIAILLISLWIAIRAKFDKEIVFIPVGQNYLFSYNTAFLSIFSNIGTLFSISMYCAGGFILGYAYGKDAYWGTSIGFIGVGVLFFHRACYKPSFLKEYKTISNYIGSITNIKIQGLLVFIIFIHCLGIISAELFFIRSFFSEFVIEGRVNPLLLSFSFIVICYFYTKAGGLLGVLKTDLFQFLVIVTWLGWSVAVVSNMEIGKIAAEAFQTTHSNLKEFQWYNHFLLNIIGISIYILTLVLFCMGVFSKTFGTLKTPKGMRVSLGVTIPVIFALTFIPLRIGVFFHEFALLENVNIFEAPFKLLIGVISQSNSLLYTSLTAATIVAITLTTIDSLLLFALQNMYCFNERSSKTVAEKILRSEHVMTFLAILSCMFSLNISFDYVFTYLVFIFSLDVFSSGIILNGFIVKKKYFRDRFKNNKISYFQYMYFSLILFAILYATPVVRRFIVNNFHIAPIVIIIFCVVGACFFNERKYDNVSSNSNYN